MTTPPPRSSLAAGFVALSHRKLILLLALSSAALGVIGAMPMGPAFQDALAGTLAGHHFIQNHPTFAPTDFLDFLRERKYAILGTRRSALAVGVVGVFLQVFLAGGIIAVLGRGPFSFRQFAEPARRNLWHNLKCLALFAVSTALILGLWLGGMAAATKKLLEQAPPDAAMRSFAWWVMLVVAFHLFAGLSLIYDFARAARRYAPTIGAWRAWRFARRTLAGSWLPAFGLFLFWFIAGGGVVLAVVGAAWGMTAISLPAIAVLFLLQFVALCLRAAVRVAAWGSYVGFLDSRARATLSSLS
jgi:hypothetical protein